MRQAVFCLQPSHDFTVLDAPAPANQRLPLFQRAARLLFQAGDHVGERLFRSLRHRSSSVRSVICAIIGEQRTVSQHALNWMNSGGSLPARVESLTRGTELMTRRMRMGITSIR